MKTVSVIVPTYNSGKYIKACLDSICGQTYRALEIIVIDDGSMDSTVSIIKTYTARDERIVPYYNENHGVSYSRNFGLEHCSGEYVTFIDSDDIVAPDFIEQMVSNLEDSKADIAVIGVAKSNSFKPELFTNGTVSVYKEVEVLEQVFGKFEGFVCNKLYKKSLLQTKSVHLEQNIAVCEDLLFNVSYLLNCGRAVYNSGQKYFYRQIESSASNRLDNPKWFDAMKAYQQIFEQIKDYPDVCKIAAFQYSMFLCAAKYRIRFVEDKDNIWKREIDVEYYKMHHFWKKFSFKQQLKLLIFSIAPGVVVRYQRRKLD